MLFPEAELSFHFIYLFLFQIAERQKFPAFKFHFTIYDEAGSRPRNTFWVYFYRFFPKLSDLYEHKCEEYDLDLSCVVYNINPGYNEELKEKSKVISGYTAFVEKVRRYSVEAASLEDAINCAIDECIEEDVLAEFFERRREEVLKMEVLDFTFERRLQLEARDSREEGREEGREDMVFSLVSKNLIEVAAGAEELQLSVESFVKKMTEAGYQVPV